MKDKFMAKGRRGLGRTSFVHAVFMHLYQTTKGLHAKADAARVVAMLDELFDQIGEFMRWRNFMGRGGWGWRGGNFYSPRGSNRITSHCTIMLFTF